MQVKKIALIVASVSRATQLLSFFADDAKRAGFEVSVFCPDNVYVPLQDFLAKKSITRFQLIRVPQRSGLAVFNHLRYFALLDHRLVNKFQERFRLMDFKTSGFFLPYVVWPAARFARLLPFCRHASFWDALEMRLFGNERYYREIFSRNHFEWVVFPGPVLRAMSELQLFVAAKAAHLKVAAVDEAFGQFAILPVPFRHFDRIFVWNHYTVDEGMRYHSLHRESFVIAGPLRFDSYFKGRVPSRDTFFASHGLDPARQLVGVVLSGVDIEYAIIDRIIKKMREQERPFQIVVRVNPFLSKSDEYSLYRQLPGVHLTDSRDAVLYSGFTPLQSQMADLAALLKYSDVIVSQASTVAIEAAIFGTPTVYHLFDLQYVEERVTAGRLIRGQEAKRRVRYDEWPSIANVLKSGSVPLARSMDELMQLIDDALASRDRFARGRSVLVKDLCTYTDGRAGERIVKELYARSATM